MAKTFRQEQILKLVRAQGVRSQADLAAALRRAGVAATQVTLSRDLKELGIVKTAGGYAELAGEAAPPAGAAAAAGAGEWRHILREFGCDLRPAQNLLVIRTVAGAAPTVAAALDRARWSEVAGTLAGDDTVLLVFATPRQRLTVEERVRGALGGGEGIGDL